MVARLGADRNWRAHLGLPPHNPYQSYNAGDDRTGVALIDGDQQPFPRPMSKSVRSWRPPNQAQRRRVARRSDLPSKWALRPLENQPERYGGERVALHVPYLLL